MGRTPCCDKMGLKKGPWTAEEDSVLVSYINQNGHGNWRALPQRAGLSRCGKSCRLRWMNYLRPDIKRGNFTREEEETIFKLHQELGNRWSVIAARLPGRTDNEIKNVWHTHLKKRLTTNKQIRPKPEPVFKNHQGGESSGLSSPVHSTSEISSLTTTATGSDTYFNHLPEADEGFWSEVFSGDDSSATSDLSSGNSDFSGLGSVLNMDGGMDFWNNLLDGADQLLTTELPQF